ncbi:MAG TPA: calcium-binding protein [Phenylobacterium sp.]|nr:calcium-binding protein [Phenylobacterium sp.]
MPSNTPTADGGQVETFVTSDPASGAQILHVQKLDAGGAPVGAEFDVQQNAPFLPVSVAALSNGGYAVVYGYAFRGWNYEVSVFDASGTALKTFGLAGFGDGVAIAASSDGGFLIADRETVQTSAGTDYDGPPLLTLYDNAGNALGPAAQLTGDTPTLAALADGHYQVTWTDGTLTHSLDYDPHNPPDFAKPAAPAVQVIDDFGAQQGAVAAGQPTDDPTPTLRVAVSQQGFLDITFTQGGGDDPKLLGGIVVTAADVARGYVDVPEQATAAGPYDAFVHFKSLDGVASDATEVSVVYQPAAATGGSESGEVLTGASGGATLQGGAGDDTVIGADGSNYLRGGDGGDSISGGLGFNDINGNKGDDTIAGHSSIGDWLVGGQGDDLISTTTSGNILYGNLGNDTLMGGTGGDIIRGGQGDDSIVAGSGAEWISGDRGSDTIQAGSGADTFHTFAGAGVDQVIGFSAAKGDHVQVDAGTHYTLTQSGADTIVDMGAGDELILKNVTLSTLPTGWIFTL